MKPKDLEILETIHMPIQDKLKKKQKNGLCEYRYNLNYCQKKKSHVGNHKDGFGFEW